MFGAHILAAVPTCKVFRIRNPLCTEIASIAYLRSVFNGFGQRSAARGTNRVFIAVFVAAILTMLQCYSRLDLAEVLAMEQGQVLIYSLWSSVARFYHFSFSTYIVLVAERVPDVLDIIGVFGVMLFCNVFCVTFR